MHPERSELEALLHALREGSAPAAADEAADEQDLTWVWNAAAADPAAPETAAILARIAGDRRAMLELGIASSLLAECGGATEAGRASAERVLARVHRRRRTVRLRWLAGGMLAAAAALLFVLPRFWRATEFAFELREVVSVSTRAPVDGVAFRVRLQSVLAWSPAVFLVEALPNGVRVDQVHPLDSALAASPSLRNWPARELQAGAEVIVPPPPLDRLVFESGRGHVVIVTGPVPTTDAWLAEVAATLRAALPATSATGLTAAHLQAATAALAARGASARWRQVP
ncbi:MAG: hypothetical protein MUC36_18305 [Planctomycetes bacterium]|jgi:hypothetical protein|nr:hypothetical protein [Planctomycetota bacterium]